MNWIGLSRQRKRRTLCFGGGQDLGANVQVLERRELLSGGSSGSGSNGGSTSSPTSSSNYPVTGTISIEFLEQTTWDEATLDRVTDEGESHFVADVP